MRSVVRIAFLTAAVTALAAPTGRAAARDTSITSLPPSVTQGGTLHLVALSVGGLSCSLTVRYADGKSQSVGTKRMSVFKVAWTWRVPLSAVPGAAHASLACGTAGSANGSFLVRQRAATARVAVVKTGLTQVGAEVSYGIVLANTSAAADALDVEVGITLLDGARHAVVSGTRSIAAIAAGGAYYLGGALTTHGATTVVSVQAVVHVGRSKPKSIVAPVVSDVRLTPHTADAGAYVDGQLANRAGSTLSSSAAVSAVFLDAAGKVVGGGSTLAPFALPPGGVAAFEISTPVAATAIASVEASVEPRYGP